MYETCEFDDLPEDKRRAVLKLREQNPHIPTELLIKMVSDCPYDDEYGTAEDVLGEDF